MSIKQQIIEKGKAAYPAIYLQTSEETLALQDVKEAADTLKRAAFFWTMGKGLYKEGTRPEPIKDTEMPLEVLTHLESQAGQNSQIYVLKLFHHFLEDPLVQTKIRSLIGNFAATKKMLILVSPVLKIPPELERDLDLIEAPLPGEEGLLKALQGITDGMPAERKPNPEVEKALLSAALGLTTMEAQGAFALSTIRPSTDTDKRWDPNVVMAEKCAALRKTGLLDYVPVDNLGLEVIGGLGALKKFVRLRRNAFSDQAREYGIPAPKGVLLLGPAGTGKSLGAKAISSELKLPLLRMDFGRIHGALVGESEKNVRMALSIAERLAPCVLWIDEIEKGIAGSDGKGDSGVGARVLGTVLTWMQEKKKAVYVYATANRPDLPHELVRKGRFDEIFSVDLPTEDARREILTIHLKKRKRYDMVVKSGDDLKDLAMTSLGFTGAEIEACIESAMIAAFDDGMRAITLEDVVDAIHSMKPQAMVAGPEMTRLREWCRRFCVSADEGELVNLEKLTTFTRNIAH